MDLSGMNKTPLYFAVHPSWAQEASKLAADYNLVKKIREDQKREYLGPAFDPKAAFDPDEVYQINDREFVSYGDGLRYRMSDSGKRVAVINMRGVFYAGSFYNDYQDLSERIAKAEDPAYDGVLIVADSPGGSVNGMPKLNKAISNFSKPIGVFVSGYLTSAAAYVTAGADFIVGDADNNNMFGSIGVFSLMENISEKLKEEKIEVAIVRNSDAVEKFKPNAYEKWTDEDLKKVEDAVEKDAQDFHAVMINQRGLDHSQFDEVKKGGTFDNGEALANGLVDDLGSLPESVEKVANYENQLLFI